MRTTPQRPTAHRLEGNPERWSRNTTIRHNCAVRPLTASTDGHRHTVLVVDDEPQIRDVFVDALTEDGHRATAAADGIEALRLLHDGWSPCLVLADVVMPGMNGHELRGAVEGDASLGDLAVVVVSSYPPEVHGGATPKPMDLTDLGLLVDARCRAVGAG
jgi:CheY-like chemotaxis protein